ncbi:hypothetical protein LQW54_005621 [Pestalotiopsis sp. IQ-011]
MINHDADSRILETYYLNSAGFTDLTSLGLGQHGTEDDRSSVMAHENHPLALGALAFDPQALVKAHGPALNAIMANMLATSELEERTKHKERLFRRRVRWGAKKAVLSEESQEMRRTLLTIDYPIGRSYEEAAYQNQRAPKVHIVNDTALTKLDAHRKSEHMRLKYADGLNQPGWDRFQEKHVQLKYQKDEQQKRKALLHGLGLQYSKEKPFAAPPW